MNIDDLFGEEVRTSTMMAAVNYALNHNIEGCNFCVKQALAWKGVLNLEDRIKTLKSVASKIKHDDKIAAHIITSAILNQL